MRWMGLDEAGRGSVLGPMAVGAFVVDAARLPEVVATGATDSKKLSAKRRERIREALGSVGVGEVTLISAAEIDAGNMNTLEEEAFAALIRRHRPDRVTIDAPCHPAGIPAFKRRLLGRLEHEPELIVEPKADLNYPVCGAASIFAKVERDARIEALGAVGSGYPSDPVTRRFIQGFLDRGEPLPDCVRSRWGTIGALSQPTLFG